MKIEHFISLLALLLVPQTAILAKQSVKQNVTKADVIVYGSTPGGFCAAIAAAREGATVILLEPTGHVGGLNTGGLSHQPMRSHHRDGAVRRMAHAD